MKYSNKITNIIFIFFIFTFFFLHIIMPDKNFSDDENRVLTSFPEITLESLLDGKQSVKLQKYLQDQFPFRTEFVETKTRLDNMLGKTLINEVYIGENYLIQQFELVNLKTLDSNINKINEFAVKVDKPISLLIIPSAAYIYSEMLPENHINSNQDDLLVYIKSNLSKIQFIDVRYTLKQQKENAYFKTDHHLTLQGTSVVYNQFLADSLMETKNYNFDIVSDNFKGSLSSKSGAFWISGDEIQHYSSKLESPITVTINDGETTKTTSSVYTEENLNKKDKYTYYLDGNHALVEISTNQPSKSNILILTDSYGHALAPFIIEDYNNVTFIDMRYYKKPISEIINNYDEILIYYSLVNFSTDNNLSFLK